MTTPPTNPAPADQDDATRPLTTRLKDDNWDLHQIAERGDGPAALMRGEGTKADYIKMLEQEYPWHVALDQAVCAARNADQRVADLIPESHLRALGIADDLAYFDSCPCDISPVPGTARFIDYIEKAESDPMVILGLHYVRTGATNGNRFVAKKLRPMFELPETGEGTAYLDPWGEEQRSIWATFKAALGEVDFTKGEQDRIFRGVRDSYLYHIGMSHPDKQPSEQEILAAHADSLDKKSFDESHAVKAG